MYLPWTTPLCWALAWSFENEELRTVRYMISCCMTYQKRDWTNEHTRTSHLSNWPTRTQSGHRTMKSTSTAWHAMNKKQIFCLHALWAYQLLANQMKPQLAVSCPDKINWHQFGGDCQVMMTDGGEKRDEKGRQDLVVKRNSTECVLIVWVCMYVSRK